MKIHKVYHYVRAQLANETPLFKFPQFPIVGPSNVGKSTLINALLGSKIHARVGKTPGKTDDIHFFLINELFHLVDLPGFGYARRSKQEKNRWEKMIFNYLNNNKYIEKLFFINDIRRDFTKREEDLLIWFRQLGIQTIVILNKSDKLAKNKLKLRIFELEKAYRDKKLSEKVIAISALHKIGIEPLFNVISK